MFSSVRCTGFLPVCRTGFCFWVMPMWYHVKECMNMIKQWSDRTLDGALYALVLLLPWFFCTWTIDALEMPKQLLLVVLAGVMGVAWVGGMVAERQARLSRGWMQAAVLVFGVVGLLTTLLAVNRGQAFFSYVTDQSRA